MIKELKTEIDKGVENVNQKEGKIETLEMDRITFAMLSNLCKEWYGGITMECLNKTIRRMISMRTNVGEEK